jgi:hypothetical protein
MFSIKHQTTGHRRSVNDSVLWVLDECGVNFQDSSFFFDFLKILRGRIPISRSWKDEIRKAAVLAGESQCSSDLRKHFYAI